MFAKLMQYTPMYKAFGFVDTQPILIGFIIVMSYIMIPLNTVSTTPNILCYFYIKLNNSLQAFIKTFCPLFIDPQFY